MKVESTKKIAQWIKNSLQLKIDEDVTLHVRRDNV